MRPGEGYAEELRLQALIAAEHARAPTAAATDWAAIARHYATLDARTGSAVVRLNRVVAVAEAEGPGRASPCSPGSTTPCPTTTVSPPSAPSSHAAPATPSSPGRATAQLSTCRANDVERAHLRAGLDAT